VTGVTGSIRLFCAVLTIQIAAAASGFANEAVIHLPARDVAALIDTDRDIRVLDVRFGFEYSKGHIEGAQRINYLSPFFRRDVSRLDRSARWVVHCKSGHRSIGAVRIMAGLGFIQIIHMDGGFDAWRKADLPIAQ